MRKHLLFVAAAFSCGLVSFSQCDPLAHDWGTATFGVSPNPSLGETFETGVLGQPYSDVIYVKVPTLASDINEQFSPIPIDSLKLDGITVFNGVADVSLSTMGLNVFCNNNGDCADPCMFLGGNAYCGDVTGIPNTAGTFPVKINVIVYGNFGFFTSVPYQFENYTLTVIDPASVVLTKNIGEVALGQNAPNPADVSTLITFDLPFAANTHLVIQNLVGEKIFDKMIQGKRGENNYRLDSSNFPNGIYLYHIQMGDKKITRRMIVQH
ncbi:MAG: T9SS type A sorting domain-containing protein [Crocinitomicaceae bacterium]|nr:T9SS type A sorting domain-containing protein [Crocinitomicaceae bacterium]